ncbi:DUF6510 family protein [Glycomyces harbinensis]|uniref:MJ0042 family finger-like domain-containing protein n=1 Tax=Glycomyces harbinensis TaxID=58114 RepID=A0A1G6V3Y1_9ACTN|nr:DUF6510 family protein [Glycomyces harbinensis]SDD48359.1 hypothetical protein SAMN05216270_104193 [Glycomyces harbinensis]
MNDHVDGNMLAGALWQVFRPDITTAEGRCATCGMTGPVASLHVYTAAPGTVARCAGCQQVTLQLVQSANSMWLSTAGLSYLRFPNQLR